MRQQGFSSPCSHAGGGTGKPLQNGALAAPREAFMHSNNRTAMKLQTALHRSRSSTSRPRVRRRPEHEEASPGHTPLVPAGETGSTYSTVGTRLALSAVMAGDESIEHPSVTLKKRGAAATSTAWGLGPSGSGNSSSSGSSSRAEDDRGIEKEQQQQQQHERVNENMEEKLPLCTQSTAVGAAASPRKEVRLASLQKNQLFNCLRSTLVVHDVLPSSTRQVRLSDGTSHARKHPRSL